MKRFELCRTKQERIQWLAENNVVEKIVIKTIKQQMDIEDLVAEIYLILLEKEDECIEKMDDKRLRNYVISIVRNQFNSSTSPYYKNYKRHDRFNQILILILMTRLVRLFHYITKKIMIDINVEELMNDYRYEDNLFKRSLLECLHCLSEIEKKILVLYAEYNSTRMVGEIVGYSHNHIAKMLREIRIKVVQYII